MGLRDWYHERRIRKLSEEHPEVDRDIIRADYYSLNSGHAGLILTASIRDSNRSPDYIIDVVSSVMENLPSSFKRIALTLSDTLLT
ncbi:MAG: hypothetical protein IIA87_04555 [Nanoarchaeota archaeon]|nr:hypothetical protein [Nanoarchaeota archaeon]